MAPIGFLDAQVVSGFPLLRSLYLLLLNRAHGTLRVDLVQNDLYGNVRISALVYLDAIGIFLAETSRVGVDAVLNQEEILVDEGIVSVPKHDDMVVILLAQPVGRAMQVSPLVEVADQLVQIVDPIQFFITLFEIIDGNPSIVR